MIIYLFNSSIVSGPETLVLPAVSHQPWPTEVWFLVESRLPLNPINDPILYAKQLGLTVREIRVESRWDFRAIAELADWMQIKKPNLVHAQDVKASIYLAVARWKLKLKGLAVPVGVTTHHGVRARFSLKLKFYEHLYCLVSSLGLDAIYTVCTSDAELLRKRWYIFSNKIKVHLNGVTRDLILEDQRRLFREKYLREWSHQLKIPLPTDAQYLGVVGRLSFEKNHRTLFAVFAKSLELNKSTPSFERGRYLLVFGSGPLEQDLKAKVRELGLENQILFMGYQPNMAGKLAALDVVVSFSLFEGLPISLIEAAWSGTPIIAYAIDGHRDLVNDSKLGLLLDPSLDRDHLAPQLNSALSDPMGLQKKGEALQRRVKQKFSESVWVKQMVAHYREHSVKVEEVDL